MIYNRRLNLSRIISLLENRSGPLSELIADAINSRNTMAQLQDRFGDDILNFIGYLYREGCIGFE